MAATWFIIGEAGKAWGSTPNTLEGWNISSAKLDFKSLDADEFTFNVLVKDIRKESFCATPVVTPDSSVLPGTTVNVTVSSATIGSSLYYTTDGSNPNFLSTPVANGGTISLPIPSLLKVVASKTGLFDSDINVADYRAAGVSATGGSVSDASGFRTHTFLSSGSFVVAQGGSIEYLVVGGGGAGGANSTTRSGGGGGAGGFKTGTLTVTPGTYAVTVGSGGLALIPQTAASDGGGSSIGTLVTTNGGGAGASVSGTTAVAGRAGGSGGGGTCAGAGGTGVVGQGKNGGTSAASTSGTGGGASVAGAAVSALTTDGGAGTASSITGSAVTYSVGGGVRNPALTTGTTVNGSIVANTGRGGAGCFLSTSVRAGANGSSGIVVIKYASPQGSDPDNIDSIGSNLPTLRQKIYLYRNDTCVFHGHVTNLRSMIASGSHEHQVTVSGAWWWLEKVNMTGVYQDSSGGSAERMAFVHAATPTTGRDLKVSIQQTIDRASQLGCPVSSIYWGSTVADMHVFPRISLYQSSIGQSLSELIRLCPDTMTYFDYAWEPALIHVVRRPTCQTVNFDQNTSPITSIDINPRIELEVQQVSLPAVTRATDGRTLFNNQSSGVAQVGTNITKKQIITISGPELDTYLPNDYFDSATITTAGSILELAHDTNSQCVAAARQYGYGRLPVSIYYDRVYSYDMKKSSQVINNYITTKIFNIGGYVMKETSTGSTLSGWSVLTTAVPDWTGIITKNATVTGQMWDFNYKWQSWWSAAGFTVIDRGYPSTDYDAEIGTWVVKNFAFTCTVAQVNQANQTIYKDADYSFINPPAGLANFLRSTQNWTPYEGAINLTQQDVGGTKYVGKKINVINSLPAFSTMGALVVGETLDIMNGQTSIKIGAPARIDYRTLVDRIRKTSQDNIIYV